MKIRLDKEMAEPGADERHFEMLEAVSACFDGKPRSIALDVLMNIVAIVMLEAYGREAPEKAKDFAKEVRRCILKNAHVIERKH